MLSLKIFVKISEIIDFKHEVDKQIPYATALALTTLAKESVKTIKKQLPNEFILRNRRTLTGIDYQRAEKSDWPKCYALVGSLDKWMVDQEEGGARTKTGKSFSLPFAIRPNIRSLIKRNQWPGRLLKGSVQIPMGGRRRGSKNGRRRKEKPFLAMKNGRVGLYVRTGEYEQARGKRKEKLKLLYRFHRGSIHLKATHWLSHPVEMTFATRVEAEALSALRRALR
jgi:hypothetical protein